MSLARRIRRNATKRNKYNSELLRIVEGNEELKSIFNPTLEDLTEELVDELSKEMPRKTLLEAQEMGLRYNRVRNSFM
jgi:hypothetical protein